LTCLLLLDVRVLDAVVAVQVQARKWVKALKNNN